MNTHTSQIDPQTEFRATDAAAAAALTHLITDSQQIDFPLTTNAVLRATPLTYNRARQTMKLAIDGYTKAEQALQQMQPVTDENAPHIAVIEATALVGDDRRSISLPAGQTAEMDHTTLPLITLYSANPLTDTEVNDYVYHLGEILSGLDEDLDEDLLNPAVIVVAPDDDDASAAQSSAVTEMTRKILAGELTDGFYGITAVLRTTKDEHRDAHRAAVAALEAYMRQSYGLELGIVAQETARLKDDPRLGLTVVGIEPDHDRQTHPLTVCPSIVTAQSNKQLNDTEYNDMVINMGSQMRHDEDDSEPIVIIVEP